MKIAIHQPNYLPWIGFFDKLDQVDQFVLLDKAFHSKSGYLNRNKIKTPQGTLVLTVPLKNKGKPINEIQIANDIDWNKSGKPAFLMVVTKNKMAYRMENGVYVIPLCCLKN